MRACTDDVCLFRSVRVRKRPVTFSRTAWRAGWCWPGSAWRARALAQAAWTGPCGRPLSRWQMSGRRTPRSSRQPTTAQRHDAGSEQQQRTTVCNYVLRQWSWIVFFANFSSCHFRFFLANFILSLSSCEAQTRSEDLRALFLPACDETTATRPLWWAGRASSACTGLTS